MATPSQTSATPPASARYCRKCEYNLSGLSSDRCPECGRKFDPKNLKTTRPRKRRLPAWVVRGLLIVATPVVLYAAMIGWLYLGWRAEQPGIKAFGSGLFIDPLAMPWVIRIIPLRLQFIQDRVRTVNIHAVDRKVDLTPIESFGSCRNLFLDGITDENIEPLLHLSNVSYLKIQLASLSDESIVRLGRLHKIETFVLVQKRQPTDRMMEVLDQWPHLRRLEVWSKGITDQGMRHVASCPELRTLVIDGKNISDASCKDIATLTHLPWLDLSESQVDDSGVALLSSMPELASLDLDGCMNVTDAAVPSFARMPKLQEIGLRDCKKITDAAIPALKRMTQLKELYISRTSITEEGAAELHKALPNCKIGY